MANNNERKLGKIAMKGSAMRTVPYDVMEIILSFKVKEQTSKLALEKLDAQCENMLQEMKNCGIKLTDITISDNQVRRYDNGAVPYWLKQELEYADTDIDLSRYEEYAEASKSLKFKLAFDMKIRNLIDQIVMRQNLDVAIDTDYQLSSEEEIRKELLEEAIAKSKAMAKLLAESAGQKVIGVKEIAKSRDYVSEEYCLMCSKLTAPESEPRLLDEVSADTCLLEESIEIIWLIE